MKNQNCFTDPNLRARDSIVTLHFLNERANRSLNAGYTKQKWIVFCETLLSMGFHLKLYEAKQTNSKYITVCRQGSKKSYKVRFSNHAPAKQKELLKDCDFFVGVTNFQTTTMYDALHAVYTHYKDELLKE